MSLLNGSTFHIQYFCSDKLNSSLSPPHVEPGIVKESFRHHPLFYTMAVRLLLLANSLSSVVGLVEVHFQINWNSNIDRKVKAFLNE